MAVNTPLQVGIIGMGGFALTHHKVVRELEALGQARLRATCDPGLAQFDTAAAPYEFGPGAVAGDLVSLSERIRRTLPAPD